MDHIDEEGRSLLGELVVYVCKHILPEMGRENDFKLGCPETRTPEDKERQEMRNEFASKLHVYADDAAYFLAEGISIIFPLVVRPHKDLKNDWHKYFSGTICINCMVPLSSIQNESIRRKLISVGYTDKMHVPCCVVLYSRKVCREYFNLRTEIANLSVGRNEQLVKVVVDAMSDIRGERDYIGNIFDAADSLEVLNKRGWGGTDAESNVITLPSAYDIMSRWSCILDFMFEYHCSIKKLNVQHVLEYILFIVFDEISVIHAAAVIRKIFTAKLSYPPEKLPGGGIYRRMIAIAKNLNIMSVGKFENKKHRKGNIKKLLALCNEASISLHEQKCAGEGKEAAIDMTCRLLLTKLMQGGRRRIRGVDVTLEMGKKFIQLGSLLGLIPLRCVTWASVTCTDDRLSKVLGRFDGLSDIETQRKEFDGLVSAIRKKISNQVSGSVIEHILLVHAEKEATAARTGDTTRCNMDSSCNDHYFRHTHRNQQKIQDFYRLKYGSEWEIQMLIDGKSKTVTNWKHKQADSYLYWETKNDYTMDLDSRLIMSEEMVIHKHGNSNAVTPRHP